MTGVQSRGMSDVRAQALARRWALRLGVVGLREVQTWAQAGFEVLDDPPAVLADLITWHLDAHVLDALDALAREADRAAALAELSALVRSSRPGYREASFIWGRVEELCAVEQAYDQSFAPLPDEACVLHAHLRERHAGELSKGDRDADLDFPALLHGWLDEALRILVAREREIQLGAWCSGAPCASRYGRRAKTKGPKPTSSQTLRPRPTSSPGRAGPCSPPPPRGSRRVRSSRKNAPTGHGGRSTRGSQVGAGGVTHNGLVLPDELPGRVGTPHHLHLTQRFADACDGHERGAHR